MIEGLFVLLLVVVVLAVPVVVTLLAKGSEAKRKERELTRHLDELEWRLYDVEQYLRRQAEAERAPGAQAVAVRASAELGVRQAARPEPAATTVAEPVPAEPPSAAQPSTPLEIPVAAPAPAPAPSTAAPEPAPAEPAARSARPRRLTPESPFEPAAVSPAKSLDWESLIGVRLFAWLGGIALFLGGAFFLQYSIQHELIAPPVRVALGLGVGALALFGGDRLRSRASWAAEALSGAGVAILYSALFSAHSLYHLIESGPTFGAMALVTLTAGMLAVKRGTFVVALLGLLGGMATPYLLSTGEDRPLSLFAYIALLGVGVVVVSWLRGWPWLSLIGVLGSAVIFGGWSDRYLTDARVPYALLAQALVFGLYGYAQSRRSSKPGALGSVVAVLTVVAPLGFVVAFCSSNELEPKPWFLVGYLLVLSAGALLVDARRKLPGLVAATGLLGVAALVARTDASLFPAEQTSTLLAFALFPSAYAAWAFAQAKRVPAGRWARFAASLALFGALPIVWRALDALPREASVLGLFAFAAFHAALLLGLAAQARSGVLQVFAQVLSLAAVSVLLDRYDSAHPGLYAALISVSGACFWVAPLAHERLRGDVWAWLSGALALPAHFLLAYGVLHGDVSNGVLGMAAVVCSALALGSLAVQRKQGVVIDKPSSRLSALLGAIVLGFISSAVPILLSNEWITVSWALIAGALCWLYRRLPHRGLLVAIGVLGAAVCVRLLANPALWEYHERSGVRILNFYLYTFGVPAVSFLLGAHLLAQTNEASRPEPGRLAALLRIAAIVFAFFLLNVEVADYFSSGSALTFHLSDGSLSEDMTYSLAWGAFALILLTIGIVRDIMNLRVGAILFLTLTLLKVTLHDLWALGGLYRVGSLMGVAFALLLVSFLTQRLVLKKGRA